MYKAILFLFFVVVCLTAVVFTTLKIAFILFFKIFLLYKNRLFD